MKPPIPFFGSKRQAAETVWELLGDVDCYIEPFAGSLAVLLARPHVPRTEIVVDSDGLILNFWRALRNDWEGLVTHPYTLGPVAEDDVEGLHRHLVDQRAKLTAALRSGPEFYDLGSAAAWFAGVSTWLGQGWCSRIVPSRQRPHLDRTLKGLYAQGLDDERLEALARRLEGVVLLSGDWADGWQRAMTPSILRRFRGGVGVFLDPPYESSRRQRGLYTYDRGVHASIIAKLPEMLACEARVVIAGYDDEWPELDGWTTHPWKTPNGYAGTDDSRRRHETLYCSP